MRVHADIYKDVCLQAPRAHRPVLRQLLRWGSKSHSLPRSWPVVPCRGGCVHPELQHTHLPRRSLPPFQAPRWVWRPVSLHSHNHPDCFPGDEHRSDHGIHDYIEHRDGHRSRDCVHHLHCPLDVDDHHHVAGNCHPDGVRHEDHDSGRDHDCYRRRDQDGYGAHSHCHPYRHRIEGGLRSHALQRFRVSFCTVPDELTIAS
ncbi:hypothetical protein C8Q76DRAFT_231899 [Earliella scabrosa]|nr:hypothetical protein C8Q76DRAFT_231899 [Earliella scabrosa]